MDKEDVIYTHTHTNTHTHFPGGSMVKNLPSDAGDVRNAASISGSGRFPGVPWNRKWQSTLIFLPGKFHGRRSLVVYSPWGLKSST